MPLMRSDIQNDSSQLSGAHYYVLMGGQSRGPYPIHALRTIPGFTLQTPIRLSEKYDWKAAFTVVDLKAYFATTQRPESWNTAPDSTESPATKVWQAQSQVWSGFGARKSRSNYRIVFLLLLGGAISATACLGHAGYLRLTLPLGRHSLSLSIPPWRQQLLVKGHQLMQKTIFALAEFDRQHFTFGANIPAPLPAPILVQRPPVPVEIPPVVNKNGSSHPTKKAHSGSTKATPRHTRSSRPRTITARKKSSPIQLSRLPKNLQ